MGFGLVTGVFIAYICTTTTSTMNGFSSSLLNQLQRHQPISTASYSSRSSNNGQRPLSIPEPASSNLASPSSAFINHHAAYRQWIINETKHRILTGLRRGSGIAGDHGVRESTGSVHDAGRQLVVLETASRVTGERGDVSQAADGGTKGEKVDRSSSSGTGMAHRVKAADDPSNANKDEDLPKSGKNSWLPVNSPIDIVLNAGTGTL